MRIEITVKNHIIGIETSTKVETLSAVNFKESTIFIQRGLTPSQFNKAVVFGIASILMFEETSDYNGAVKVADVCRWIADNWEEINLGIEQADEAVKSFLSLEKAEKNKKLLN